MRVFLDACIDSRAAKIFAGHQVATAFDLGWHGLKDAALLRLVQERFDVIITIDRGFEHEHNLKNLAVGIVIVHVAKNKAEYYQALASDLLEAMREVRPGSIVHVPPRRR